MDKQIEQTITIEVVHQKIGRNLLLFQKLELMLKAMVAILEVSGNASSLPVNAERRKSWAMKLTLGQIIGEHINSFNRKEDEDAPLNLHNKEPFFTFKLSSECEEHVLDKRRSVLAGFVAERNEMVHQLLTRYDLKNQTDLKTLVEHLDDQYQRLNEEVKLTHKLGKSQFELRKEALKCLETDEIRDFLLGSLPAPNEENGK